MNRTIRTDFLHILRKNGIKDNSRAWSDYERAKKLIPIEVNGSKEYYKYYIVIAEYLGLKWG